MTDRELLELAAKAAGLTFDFYRDSISGWLAGNYRENEDGEPVEAYPLWRPLRDDGDALRLAVKLGVHIGFYGDHVAAQITRGKLITEQRSDGDVPAATRRAIVRAAAAMAPDSDARDPHPGDQA